ncbi:ABC transporter substrate-binding protein [Actinomadura atramentaria]|uniref:ABC transporter substrate-binding protein n=1 Tax=Actinomadura atramentaria TaxID=1990 RepID=UPI000373945E|nr:ABC transporter substrate-binding protein [Actinomadura atramentaria]
MHDELSRRGFLARGTGSALGIVMLAGGGNGLLAACSSSDGTAADGEPGVSTETPKRGGTLTVGVLAEQKGFNPLVSNWDTVGLIYGNTIFDTLTRIDADGKWAPNLAESITVNDEATEFRIKARAGVAFHDGTPCDAAAIAASLTANWKSESNGPALLNVKDVKAKGDEVVVTAHTPWPAFPYYLSEYCGVVLAPAMLKDKNGLADKPIGTGPFKFQSWTPNDKLVVVRNEKYWRDGLPYLDQVVFKPIADDQSRANALKAGDVDLVHCVGPKVIQQLKDDSSVASATDEKGATERNMDTLMINTAKAPFDDLRVRQALAYATDRDRLRKVIDVVNPASDGPFGPGSPYHSETGFPKFNLSRAKQLVAEYEREKGKLPVITLTALNDQTAVARAQMVQAMWKNAGIECKIEQLAQGQAVLNALLGKYDVVHWTQFAAGDPDLNYTWWSELTAAPIGKPSLNFTRFKDADLQKALVAGRTSVKDADRVAAYQQVAKVFAEKVPYIWLNQAVYLVAAKPAVRNWDNGTLPGGKRAQKTTTGVINVTETWRR